MSKYLRPSERVIPFVVTIVVIVACVGAILARMMLTKFYYPGDVRSHESYWTWFVKYDRHLVFYGKSRVITKDTPEVITNWFLREDWLSSSSNALNFDKSERFWLVLSGRRATVWSLEEEEEAVIEFETVYIIPIPVYSSEAKQFFIIPP